MYSFFIFALMFAVAQSQLVVPQFNNADDLISILPEFQKFVDQLEEIFPQLTTIYTSTEIQSFKEKLTETILNEIINQGNPTTLINKLQPIFNDLFSSKSINKRDVLPQISNFVSQLNSLLNQFDGLISTSQLQLLKDELVHLILNQLVSNFDLQTLTNGIRFLLEKHLGSNLRGRSDFDVLIQQIINTTTTALPGVILGMIGGRNK